MMTTDLVPQAASTADAEPIPAFSSGNLPADLRAAFTAARSPRGMGRDGFRSEPMGSRGVEKLIERYVTDLKLDPNVTVHSLRVTALTTARERGCDIIELQEFAGHADPKNHPHLYPLR